MENSISTTEKRILRITPEVRYVLSLFKRYQICKNVVRSIENIEAKIRRLYEDSNFKREMKKNTAANSDDVMLSIECYSYLS